MRENVPWDSSAPWEAARAACPAGAGPGEGPVSSPFPSDKPHPGRVCRPHDHKNRLWLIHLYIYRKLSPNMGAQGGVETQVALWVRSVQEARWSQLGPLGSTCRWGAPATPAAFGRLACERFAYRTEGSDGQPCAGLVSPGRARDLRGVGVLCPVFGTHWGCRGRSGAPKAP